MPSVCFRGHKSTGVTLLLLFCLDHPEEISIQPSSAIEGDNITLTCQAARYLYTTLQWLDSFNRTITSNPSGLQLGEHSISRSLQLHSVSPNVTRGYTCLAHRYHGRVELKKAALTVDGGFAESPFSESGFEDPRQSHNSSIAAIFAFCVFVCSSKEALADPELNKPSCERQQHPEVGMLCSGGSTPRDHMVQKQGATEAKFR